MSYSRNTPIVLLVALSVCLFGQGCTSSNLHKYTQAQLNAIESRSVDAGMEETYQAASNALFDAGYTINMSDRQGGIITGYQGKDNTAARIWVSPFIQDTRFVMSIQMRSRTHTQTDVRVKTSVNGEPRVDEKAIDKIWTLMQRQVLMKAPLEAGVTMTPSTSYAAPDPVSAPISAASTPQTHRNSSWITSSSGG